MPASFVTEHLGQRHTDMLWRIGTTAGDWVYILILLEFQSTVNHRMAVRMMDYTATIWMRLGKEELGPGGEYPFVLPVVIYNGERRWNAATDIGDLLGPGPAEPLGYRPCLRYLLIEIRAQDPASLPPDNVLAGARSDSPDGRSQVRSPHRRTTPADAGEDLGPGTYHARR